MLFLYDLLTEWLLIFYLTAGAAYHIAKGGGDLIHSADYVLAHHSKMTRYAGTAGNNDMKMIFLNKVAIYISFSCMLCDFPFLLQLRSLRLRPLQLLFHLGFQAMGGKAIRSDPTKLVVSEVARGILERAGWLNYFNRLQEPNEAVAMEFLRNLEEEHSMVGGKRIVVTEEVIAEVTGLPAVGPVWTEKRERLQRIIEVFQDEGQNLTVKGKGVLPATLGEPWSKLAKVVQSCITCEGEKMW